MHVERTDGRGVAAYEEYTDAERRRHVRKTAAALDCRVAHVNSTASGGGVAEMLGSLVPLLDDAGVETDWLVMDAPESFFDLTKAIHNGLQGDGDALADGMTETYRSVTVEAAEAMPGGFDVAVLHDPQTLGMAPTLAERFPELALVWRCHVDLTDATPSALEFVRLYLDAVDRVVVTLPEYADPLGDVPATVVPPAIDPLTAKNRPPSALSDPPDAADRPFDPDRPLVVQVSRFDPWKDPLGVLEVHRRVADRVPGAQLVLAGAMPDDDPEGEAVYREVAAAADDDPDVHLLTDLSDAGINALQRRADVVLQKSLREGFALTVSEALWKETPVVGTTVGGIPLQVDDGENGFLEAPDDLEAVADDVVELLESPSRRRRFGERGRETVRERFLTPRLLADHLELIAAAG